MKRPAIRNSVKQVLAGMTVSIFAFGSPIAIASDVEKTADSKTEVKEIDGAELFVREWVPGDQRSHGGDGLGPLFNDSSCVACHNQGATGGGGPRSKNVDILTAFSSPVVRRAASRSFSRPTTISRVITSMFGRLDEVPAADTTSTANRSSADVKAALLAVQKANREQLAGFHPGFAQGNSIVLHRNATYDGYQSWRSRAASGQFSAAKTDSLELFGGEATPSRTSRSLNARQHLRDGVRNQQFVNTAQMRLGNFVITRSQRNATALFGAGLIEKVKRETLEALAEQQRKEGSVSGRVAVLKDNRIGRFGWKGQNSSLRDFVLTACAVEVGLNVPNHPQSGIPHSPEYRPTGFDLNSEECDALVNYVADLSAPTQLELKNETNAAFVKAGAKLFAKVGCAQCHVESLGELTGIYSDLLLHDMGDELGDSGGSYGIFIPDSTPDGQMVIPMAGEDSPKVIGATLKEWQTPALWGVRDSAPYLHDGRANDLEQAIAMHGGESERSASAFFRLSDSERFQLITFLKSLVAPSNAVSEKHVAVRAD